MAGINRRYEQIASQEEVQEQPESHSVSRERLPRKEIALGMVLLILGISFFTLAHFHRRGHTGGHIKEGSEWGLATLGLLTFLPGAYCSWVAFAAWWGLLGFRYSDIPKID